MKTEILSRGQKYLISQLTDIPVPRIHTKTFKYLSDRFYEHLMLREFNFCKICLNSMGAIYRDDYAETIKALDDFNGRIKIIRSSN